MDEQPSWIWDRGSYDEVGRRLVGLAGQLLDTVEQRAGDLRGQRLLDLACGTGNVALEAARRGAAVTGVDLGSGLLEIARRRADAQGLEATWLVADATDTGLPDAAFEVAASSVGLIFVPDRFVALAEVARLLRPGGWFAYTAWVDDPESPFFTPLKDFLPADDGDGGPRTWEWAVPAVMRSELGIAFEQVEVESREFVWSFDSVDEALTFVESSPMHVAAVDGMAQADRPALRSAFVETFEGLRGSGGRLGYASPYVVVTARRRD